MADPQVDYSYVAEKLAIAIEQAMWEENYGLQSQELLLVADALRREGGKLWAVPDAAMDRATILELLEPSPDIADDPRAKELGTLALHMERLSSDDRMKLAAAMVALLRFCEAQETKSEVTDG